MIQQLARPGHAVSAVLSCTVLTAAHMPCLWRYLAILAAGRWDVAHSVGQPHSAHRAGRRRWGGDDIRFFMCAVVYHRCVFAPQCRDWCDVVLQPTSSAAAAFCACLKPPMHHTWLHLPHKATQATPQALPGTVLSHLEGMCYSTTTRKCTWCAWRNRKMKVLSSEEKWLAATATSARIPPVPYA